MSGHTPGPWGYREKAGDREVRLLRTHWEVGHPGGKGVAVVFGDDDANARLIAAAPDLLRACRMIAEAAATSGTEERFGEAVSEFLGEVQAAVAKAEGETDRG